jgi:putative transposase
MNHARDPLYRRHRFPAEVIGYAVWLYFRFPLSLRMVEEMLAARGIIVSHETIRCWAEKFGRESSKRIRRCAPVRGDKWHLDEVVITIAGLGSYETAWTWLHKLRRAMVRPGRDSLRGTVEVDETYVGVATKPLVNLLKRPGVISPRGKIFCVFHPPRLSPRLTGVKGIPHILY